MSGTGHNFWAGFFGGPSYFFCPNSTEENSTSENKDIDEISKSKGDNYTTSLTAADVMTEISKLKDDIATKHAAEISKLKDDIARLTAEISNLKDDITTRLTAEREEMKSLEQSFKKYKEDEALVKSSSFALINPRPIFPTLPQEAFSASSSFQGGGNSPFDVPWKIVHMPFNSILNKASKRQETCWSTVAANTPNSFIQVNLGQLYLVNEIQTRGRGGAEHKQWVKTYKVGYVHHEQKVEVSLLNLENGNMFDGNYSETEITSNKYFKPFIAQYIKLYPVEYNNYQSLNWEVIGVPLSKIDEKGLKMFLTSSVK